MRSLLCRSAAAASICIAFASAGAQYGTPGSLLISAQELKSKLSDPSLVILYVGPKEEYTKEHIAGARFVEMRDIATQDTVRKIALELPDEATLRASLERFGIGDKSTVVVTPGVDWGSPSTRLIWTLQAAGLGAHTRLLNGGTQGWKAAGLPVSAEVPAAAKPGKLTLAADRSVLVDYQWVQAHAKSPGIRLIDARSPVFYEGPGMPEHNSPGGHIAGAKNIPFDGLFNDSVFVKPAAELKAKFDEAGVAPGDTVVAYCHVGQQATMVLFAARLLGHPIRLYDGSMNDWQQRKLPVEGGTTLAKP
jgi:thiosulfate/3-mercaptopyruvate sulfurtransferase